MELRPGDEVVHKRHGRGTVEFPKGETAIVRFAHGLEECSLSTLEEQLSLIDALNAGQWHPPVEVIAKCQAAAIESVNDAWGVFSRSRIALLPHQLWVCHRVLRNWPIRYLVADDVGLGKTIEAGLILWPLLSKQFVRRLLILCPASLVEQWQQRLRQMFDIRLARYLPDADTKRSGFWDAHPQVVASLPTLRKDRSGRRQRMLEAEPWDLLIVDEAHHLNADESSGATLGYQLVEELLERNKVDSCVFFTGTPHRGRPFGFWSLMRLLRPDLFDPKRSDAEQVPYLTDVLIRNNKSLVTDMEGNRLFKPVTVHPETYDYTSEEATFYSQLTEFIASGKAYATSLSAQQSREVMLVLIAMQKLASSSVAAIRNALKRRLNKLKRRRDELVEQIKLTDEDRRVINEAEEEDAALLDKSQALDLQLAQVTVTLMQQEIPHLESLIADADRVNVETKIEKILEIVEERFAGQQVLLFTEYKATQALVMTALMKRFGRTSTTFINGDEQLSALELPDGTRVTERVSREGAAEAFNKGEVRFLVSTEAGGEGIDLQRRCSSLIHVDLPWNPMRLHQRVGRLNRYGQENQVEVVTLRNPATVEARIWDLLNAKLEMIMEALGSAMDEPEDLLQLVLGMTSSQVFDRMFSEGQFVAAESLDEWFNQETATFGGRSAIETVKNLVGNANRFDLTGLHEVPKVDLPHLRPFFENMLTLHRRRIQRSGAALSFKTPDLWLDEPGVRTKYEGLVFDRSALGDETAEKVLGVGHRAFDKALREALDLPVTIAHCRGLDRHLIVFQVFDRVTDESGHMRQSVVGVSVSDPTKSEPWQHLKDWEVLDLLNVVRTRETDGQGEEVLEPSASVEILEGATKQVVQHKDMYGFPYRVPEVRPLCLLSAEKEQACERTTVPDQV